MLQDDCRPLSRWFASKPDARRHAREAAAQAKEQRRPPVNEEAIDRADAGAWFRRHRACRVRLRAAHRSFREVVMHKRLTPRAELPSPTEDARASFLSGWWAGIAIGFINGVGAAVIARHIF